MQNFRLISEVLEITNGLLTHIDLFSDCRKTQLLSKSVLIKILQSKIT